MSDLIARLEAAEVGSLRLDKLVAAFINNAEYDEKFDGFHRDNSWVPIGPIKEWTTSLDAALTLVPEGWTVARINQNDDKSWATELREGFLTSYDRVVFGPANHKSPTPALALVCAALRARAPAPGERE